jgi:hypothetical protein
LHIQDGEYQMVRNLAPSEFNAGSVAYEPRSRDLGFRVEVFSPTANASGSVQVVNLPAQAALTPVWPAAPPVKPAASFAETELPAGKRATGRSEPSAPAPVAVKKEDVQASPVKSSDGSDAAAAVKREPAPPAELPKEPEAAVPEPTVRVWTEVVAGSLPGRLVGKVPLLRRLRKTAKASSPAPLVQAQPVLSDLAKKSVTGPVAADVRVNVGETGVVESAELVGHSDPLNVAVANSALAAAVRWTFEPARSEEAAVASKVILHFRFTP